jgi:hypothetical protein
MLILSWDSPLRGQSLLAIVYIAICRPGLIEDDIERLLINLLFTEAGLASFRASITLEALSYNLSSLKEIFPTDR